MLKVKLASPPEEKRRSFREKLSWETSAKKWEFEFCKTKVSGKILPQLTHIFQVSCFTLLYCTLFDPNYFSLPYFSLSTLFYYSILLYSALLSSTLRKCKCTVLYSTFYSSALRDLFLRCAPLLYFTYFFTLTLLFTLYSSLLYSALIKFIVFLLYAT